MTGRMNAWRRIRRWLRLGPTRAELIAEAELWKARNGRKEQLLKEAFARAKTAEKGLRAAGVEQGRVEELTARVAALTALVDAGLGEPERREDCSKVRFHRQEEAEDWAATIGEATGEGAEALNAYQCKVCPRSPVTMRRYWHAGHADGGSSAAKAARHRSRQIRAAEARRDGNLLAQRVDPSVLDRIRKMAEEGDSRG
jgi:hypothetical protein